MDLAWEHETHSNGNRIQSQAVAESCIACPQINLLQTDHNPDIMLLAARSLTHLADNLPTSCSSIVRHGGVPALCERLLNIEYIDLAEQSLQARPLLRHLSLSAADKRPCVQMR